MYLPPQFRHDDPALAAVVMRAHPLASLVTVDGEGLPFITHLPLHLREGEGGRFTLLGHLARPNPQLPHLRERPRAVVTFLGPHAYLSPAVYPDAQRVPTWNYVAVHCTVQAALVEDEAGKDRLLKSLIGDHEPAYADQWRAQDPGWQGRMLAGVTGLVMEVQAWACKLKINQHRPEAREAMRARYLAGGPDERALVAWMDRLDDRRNRP